MEFKEFVEKYYPGVIKAYIRYNQFADLLPIGTRVITLRAGFGGIGDDLRFIKGYYKKDWKFSTEISSDLIAYCLGNFKDSNSQYLSTFEYCWKDFKVED